MSAKGVLFVRCPKCQTAVCSGIVTTVSEALRRFANNSSFCLVCRRWFKWADATAETRRDD